MSAALAESQRLKTVVIEECSNVGMGAFLGCVNLEKVVFADNIVLNEIGAGAFLNCESLKKIVLPKTLKKVRKRVFAGCVKLKAVHLAKRTELLGKDVFDGCPDLTIYTERAERDGYFQPNWNANKNPVCWNSTAYRKA